MVLEFLESPCHLPLCWSVTFLYNQPPRRQFSLLSWSKNSNTLSVSHPHPSASIPEAQSPSISATHLSLRPRSASLIGRRSPNPPRPSIEFPLSGRSRWVDNHYHDLFPSPLLGSIPSDSVHLGVGHPSPWDDDD
ncbi:hypothetical protein NE237_013564 [Protea cynaroides]|uniref:Uncharacterized protein n=1 Tax=Protea cynaroides TaxID=273540 RepID=A0A9Q0GYZ2_9MAGN|nr:hypothetical protein NE237_013564 [Protea cynaroides]